MKSRKDSPSEYKKAFISWLGIYLLITPLIYCLSGIINGLPVYIQTFILTAICTPLMYIIIPILNKLLSGKKH
jgi:antibiotic biosynthesis monooxygenase (ABM) superfamily enzyme